MTQDQYERSPEVKQTYDKFMKEKSIQQALTFIEQDHEQTIAEQITITEIPAPPFKEEVRAKDVMKRLMDLGVEDVQMDEEGNVFGIRKGVGNGPKVFISAHLDTVFPEGTDTTVHEKNGILHAPGISDDTRGLAELLSIVRACNEINLQNVGDIVFGATVGEEGAGDLRGVKAFFSNRDDIDGFLSIDGPRLGNIVYLGTGSYRYTVTYKGPGGHSFGAFGTPSATHALGRAIAKIADLETSTEPRTTFTVGEIRGGTSVNAIAEEASMDVDLRSNEQETLDALAEAFLATVRTAAAEENSRWNTDTLSVEIDKFGDRPPATQEQSAPIVQCAWQAINAIGQQPDLSGPSSTDANYPMSLGIPALALGRGGVASGTHTVKEWYDPTDAYIGVQKNFLTLIGLVGIDGVSDPLLAKKK